MLDEYGTKTIFECGGHFKKTLPEMVDWLTTIAAKAPCNSNEIIFEIDSWGDYEMHIFRPLTSEEIGERERQYEADRREYAKQKERDERAELARLQAKYGDQNEQAWIAIRR